MRARIAFASRSRRKVKARHRMRRHGMVPVSFLSMRVRVVDGVDDASVTRTKRVTTAREIWFT